MAISSQPPSVPAKYGGNEPVQMVGPRRIPPKTKLSTNNTKKTKNKILAIPAAPEATTPNPKIAATIATMKNTAAQYNMTILLILKDSATLNDLCISHASQAAREQKKVFAGMYVGFQAS